MHNASAWQEVDTHASVCFADSHFTRIPTYVEAGQPGIWRNKYGAYAYVFEREDQQAWRLVRDHFGCQPLYYTLYNEQLIFADNLPDILRCLPVRPKWNAQTLGALYAHDQIYSDETFYEGIYRVEPGVILQVNQQGQKIKQPFWLLDKMGEDRIFEDDQAYLQCFTARLNESVTFHCQGQESQLAGEFSGGLDSSAILAAAHTQQLTYPVFMHVADGKSTDQDDRGLAEQVLQHLQHQQAYFLDAEAFDLLTELRCCAQYFAGCAPYILFMLSQNINRAVLASGRSILLSGAGGDECVSGHAPLLNSLSTLHQSRGLTAARQALVQEYRTVGMSKKFFRKAEKRVKYTHPFAFHALAVLEGGYHAIQRFFHVCDAIPNIDRNQPVRELEWDRLQGLRSHSLRLRIEYAGVLAKAMGFEYRYPLLHPKLVEFCFYLPLQQKRRSGQGRYLIRRYLQACGLPKAVYQKAQKSGGIIPATLAVCRQHFYGKTHADMTVMMHQIMQGAMVPTRHPYS